MTRDQHERTRVLFERWNDEQAPDVDGLDAWLDRAGERDAVVRAEVRSLVDYHGRAGSFLDTPVAAPVETIIEGLDVLRPGAAVGPYTIRREIGRGAMGRVYLAADTRLDRDVALKAIAPQFTSDSRYRERLRREARAAAALNDPAICAVYALEEIGSQLFIASEFVDGHTLRHEIDAGDRPPIETAMSTARELAAALASAHRRGITHRDLNPVNIMRRRDGRVKVLDFGLARIDRHPEPSDFAASMSAPGGLIGTPTYMSPEQLNGRTANPASDVFAFGIVMYEYVTGVHPFDAPTAVAIAGRVLESEPVPILSRRPDLPPPFAAVIEKCLRKQPSARYASGEELATALAGGEEPNVAPSRAWWRLHEAIVLSLYVIACIGAWRLGDLADGVVARAAFAAMGVLGTIGGVVRGHLLFTERVHPTRVRHEWLRTRTLQVTVDLTFAAVLFAAGVAAVATQRLPAVLAMAMAAGLASAVILIEPSTSAATFLDGEP